MTWSRSHSIMTTVKPESIWARWTIAANWNADDPNTKDNRFPEPPQVGDSGVIVGYAGAQKIIFTEMTPFRQMTFSMKLPGAVLTLPHTIEELADGTRITHAFRLSGPLAQGYALIIGRRLIRELPHIMNLVLRHALADERRPALHE